MNPIFSSTHYSIKRRLNKLLGTGTLECINCKQHIDLSQITLGNARKLGNGQCECLKFIGHYCKKIREKYPHAFIRSLISQNESGINRYNYTNKEFNLIIWEADTGFIGFEIIFQDFIKEISIRWMNGEKPRISTVNTGTRTPFKNLTPILNGAHDINWDEFAEAFQRGMEGTEVPVLLYVKDVISQLSKDN